ncbi:MAG: signal recognition particle-docking protein FtsY [Planctomycetes bacterium]|jgi:fused signal recognition particle receptor|nr:signal recognition particle-docking protein FtsY [Planctomycetota bacterium]MDA8377081.1 signal recognition particle-docking protein FtsY [Planctomycetia bacterium]
MAFEFIRKALGQSVEKLRSGLTRTRTALVGSLRTLLTGRKLDQQLLDELRQRLISADLGVVATDHIIADLNAAWKEGRISSGEEVLTFLKEDMRAYWPEESRSLQWAASGPTVILVTGINGAGKTTSIAKLGQYLKNQNKAVMVAACDTFRAAAVDQLSIWAGRIGVDIVKHQMGSDPAAVAFDACQAAVARKMDVLIIDTAGRLHTQDHLMRELGKIRRVTQKIIPAAPHESLLVLDATIGQNAIRQAEEFAKVVDLTGIFLAKLDGTAKGGIVVAIRRQLNLPVKFVGLGETPDDIAPFNPDEFVEALFAQ